MTVDDKSFYVLEATNPEKAKELIESVKEVTGGLNEDEIKRALDKTKNSSGDFNLPRAIETLIGSQSVEDGSGTDPSTSMPPPPPHTSPSPQKPKVVDLTEDNKSDDDLQRAIALSLQDGGLVATHNTTATSTVSGVSQEDQDVSKALEASLLESTQGRKKKDPQNPHDRQRVDQWPVGLKNVGQTCWFSAVIQSLFHLPAFRVLVFNFSPPVTQPKTERNTKILDFMLELRKLFALLLSSQRKYVDPSTAVGILKGSLGGESGAGGTSNQQDVSEFTHKLLDWLEEAFNLRSEKTLDTLTVADNVKSELSDDNEPMDSESEKMDREKESPCEKNAVSASEKSPGNPMYSLFYGRVQIEGHNQGVAFSRAEQFGQWPLLVNGYKNIHDSLEASLAYQAIDRGEAGESSGQERWFTILPPVLFLELSRFQFNTSRGIAEKVNNVLEFPEEIFLDRYLRVNQTVVRAKREEVRRLAERRDNLQLQLASFTQYGPVQASNKSSLLDILRGALEFARSGTEGGGAEGEAAMQVDSPCHSPASLTPATSVSNLAGSGEGGLQPDSIVLPLVTEELMPTACDMEMEVGSSSLPPLQSCPAPRHVSELELKVLSSCLGRWSKEVEDEIAGLNKALSDVEASIAAMYDEPILKKRGYRLQAVMVHEGDANQGHYWAYVFDNQRGCWLKFNDNTVSPATWEEIEKEAVGGKTSTSAYSCVYVDVSRGDLMELSSQPLPPDLEAFIVLDNKSFAGEILRWDEEQLNLQTKTVSSEAAAPVLIGDDPECQIIDQKPDLAMSHALLVKDFTMEVLQSTAAERKKYSESKNITSLVINKIYQIVKAKHQQGKQELDRLDFRLESFLHYLVYNELTVEHYKRALLEQVALQELEHVGDVGREVSRAARESLKNPAAQNESLDQEMTLWHRAYHQYRIVVYYFVMGVEKYTENALDESLELLTTSYILNEKILEENPVSKTPGTSSSKAMVKRGLIKHFHLAVGGLNTKLVEEFECGTEPAGVARRVANVLVPAIHILQERTNRQGPGSKDAVLLEEVRGRWCAMIEQPLPERKRDYWGTIFNTVVPDDNSVHMKAPVNLRYPKFSEDLDLGNRYKSAMQRLMRESDK